MKYSRREVLGSAGLLVPVFESACVRGRPLAKLLPSRVPLPKLFEAALPVFAVL